MSASAPDGRATLAADRRGSWLLSPGAQFGKYAAIAAVTTRTNLAYLADFFLRGAFLVVVMYVFVQLWRTTYTATGSSSVGGYSLREMIWYLAMTEAIVTCFPRTNAAVGEQVRSGQLAYFLGRPHSYLLYLLASYFGEAVVRLPVNLVISGGVAWLAAGPPPLVWAAVPGLLAAITLGLSLNFAISAVIGLLAFWVEDTDSFYLLYSRLLMIFGGMLIPLEVFPGLLRRVTLALPTNLIVYGPARLFVGHQASAPEIWGLLGRQVAWLGAFWLLLEIVYRLGVKRVNVQGG